MQLVAITRQDGGLSVMTIVADQPSDAAIDAEIVKAGIDAATWRRMAGPEELPQDRVYRQAWEDDGAAIVINAERAQAIDAANAAAARDPLAEIDALKARLDKM